MKAKKKIEAIAITAIAVLAIFALIGTASATVSNLAVSPGPYGQYLYGQNITVTWNSDEAHSSYIWINSNGSWSGNDTHYNIHLYNNLTDVNEPVSGPEDINRTLVHYTGATEPYSFSYTFANWTVKDSLDKWYVYINDGGNDTFPYPTDTNNTKQFVMTAYNVTIQTGRSAADGNSTLAGDNITVYINTSAGTQAASQRDGLPFNITLDETGNNVLYPYVNTAKSGNYTFTINTTTAGVGALRNITLSYGSPVNFSWNSTQLADTAGLWSGTTERLQFNVSKVNLKAYDVAVGSSPQNITSVNITTLDGSGNLIGANPAYLVNVTLTNSITSASIISFNWTHPGFVIPKNYTVNLSFAAGDGNIPITNITGWGNTTTYGNYTHPLNTSGPIRASSGTHTITAKVNTSGTEWTDTYTIHSAEQKVTLEVPADTSYQIGEYVLITGCNVTATGTTRINITGPGTTVILTNFSDAGNSVTDGGFTHNWSTNWTWNTIQGTTWNATLNKTGIYTITAGNDTSGDWHDSYTITLSEDITVTPNETSIGVDDFVWINGTTDRYNSNGTRMYFNITKGTTIVNNTFAHGIDDFNPATGLANFSMLWSPSDDVANLTIGASNTYTIKVNDSAAEGTSSITVTDSITIEPATAVPGKRFTIRGTSPRVNGTRINITIKEYSDGAWTGWSAETNATVQGGQWSNSSVYATSTLGVGGTHFWDELEYGMTANDSIVTASEGITLGVASITLDALPDAKMDDIVNITGLTPLGNETVIQFNITTTDGSVINNSALGLLNATVRADGTFNTSWKVNESLTTINGNFTAPSTSYTVKAFNGTTNKTTTINLTEILEITTTRTEIATGDEFIIEGISDRINNTQLVINITRGLFTNGTTATVWNGAFNKTLYAKMGFSSDTGANLPTGSYTIKVNDTTTSTTDTMTMVVSAAWITMTAPAAGASFPVNDSIAIVGTTNRGNGTIIDVQITKIAGEAFNNNTLTAIVDSDGNYNTTWDTSTDTQLQALTDPSGDYLVFTYNGSAFSNANTITLTVEGPYVTGDVDGDGSVTPADALAVLRIYAGIDTEADYAGASADVDDDGSISPADALEILRIYAGV